MKPNDISKEIMNDVEVDKIVAFCQDKIMFEAVKKYLLYHIYSEGTIESGKPLRGDRNWALQLSFQAINPKGMPRSNEELGADLRAFVKGINVVETGFEEIQKVERRIVEEDKEEPVKSL